MPLLTNTKLILSAVVAIPLMAIAFSAHHDNWTWFARSGGLILICGGLLATRRVIRLGVDEIFHDDHTIDGGGVVPTLEELESARQDRLDILAAKLAFGVITFGTLVCSFGDVVGRFVFSLFG